MPAAIKMQTFQAKIEDIDRITNDFLVGKHILDTQTTVIEKGKELIIVRTIIYDQSIVPATIPNMPAPAPELPKTP